MLALHDNPAERPLQRLVATFEPPDKEHRTHFLYRTSGKGAWLIRSGREDGEPVAVELCASFLVACQVAAERSGAHRGASPPGDPRRPLAMFDQDSDR